MMPHISPGIKVKRNQGEQFRKALAELGALDRCRKIASDGTYVYLPVLPELVEKKPLTDISDYELVEMEFEQEPPITTPESILGYQPSFEVVGDIAIVEQEDVELVAAALMSSCKNIRSVITPVSDVEGEFRTRRFRHVAGEERTITVHREHGLGYRVDLEGAYFTPRLGTERLRIARQVGPGDFVLDMFAGVGPFALLLAHRGAKVVAIDKNPVAVKYLRENKILNRIDLEILVGDAYILARNYENTADHVIMNLPHTAHQFLIPAIQAAKNGGVVHYYAISQEDDLYKDIDSIEAAAFQLGVKIDAIYKGVVRSYAPHRYNVVVDFRVKLNAKTEGSQYPLPLQKFNSG
jgi:tRNA (guanine37-N1)-methyltransferase